MTKIEFINAQIEWAREILDKPAYTMASGQSSHVIAYTVLNEALDQRIEVGQVNAYGQWA